MKPLILLWVFLFALPVLAREGTNSSGGGDSYAQEFTGIARSIAGSLGRNPNADRFAAEVALMRVVTEDHVYFRGAEVDARNEPLHHLIHLNRSRWKEYSDQPVRKIALVHHEVYGLLGVNDQKYERTGGSLTAEELSAHQSMADVVLRQIDDRCSDAWCESDAEYTFDGLTCDAGRGCYLELTVITHPMGDGEDAQKDVLKKGVQSRILHEGEILQRTRARCHFDRYQQPVDMLSVGQVKGGKGIYIALSSQAFDDVGECIDQLEIHNLKLKIVP